MRRLLLVAFVALAFAAPAGAAVPNVDARAFYIVNAANGDVLAAKNANEAVPIASITKLMTVIVALKHLKIDQTVTVTGNAAQVGESRIPLYRGERITVRDLLAGALIQSANNAADALAAAAAGGDISTFVGWMNERARQLGLRHTHFERPDGLDAPGHLSSARDVAVLARVAMRLPIVRELVRMRTDTIDNGWCEVAAARRNGFTIYAVILGSPDRAQRNDDLERLLAWGVSQYRTLPLVAAQTYAWAAAPYGLKRVALVAARPLVRVVRVGRPVTETIVAPTAV